MNIIELPVSELKTALTGLNKIVSKSTCLPVLKNVRVTRTTAGLVTLQATDLDAAVTYQAEAQQPGPLCDLLVPLDPLTKAVKGSPNDNRIGLIKEAKNQFTLRTYVGNSAVDQKLDALDLKEWPTVPRCELPTVALNQDIREAVASALECSGEDSTRPLLQGAWIDTSDPKANYVIGTDGKHLFTANSFCVALKEPLLLPSNKFVQWNGFMDDGDWKVAILPAEKDKEQGWLQVQSDHWTLLSKVIEGKCPAWRNAVPLQSEAKTLIRFSDQALKFLQQLLPKLPGSDDYNRGVTLELKDQTLTVKAHPKNSPDWTCVEVPDVEVKGDPITITLNRDYLLKALGFGLVNVDLYDDLSPLVFYTEGKRLIVMPIRPYPTTTTAPVPTAPTTDAATPAASPQPTASDNPNPQPQPQPEERNAMPKATTATTTTTPTEADNSNTESATKSLIQHIELIKDSLKGVIRDLNDLLDLVKKTEKEKKASDKEIEAVREKLREIQSVKI